ncbi:RNA polymerase sigma factor [Brevibacillus choshinensis]|uniref:RNA polymerase sigma factor n=1 Tax=Brevibacillus choshinensis TaxID=54911 RepID=UPI002E215655|nr:sigma factor [Brevibacillus choshinensis]
MNAHQVVEQTVRDSYGRLIAYLTINWRDWEAAEDALADAFLVALETWPKVGVPEKPEAWLLTAARRRLIDGARRARVHVNALPTLYTLSEEAQKLALSTHPFPDERLKMLFICAHPAIDPAVRTPLMLQTVMGIDAARIASAFVVKPATMGQRLTRAKAKIRGGHIQFELPDEKDLPQCLDAVLEAIYAAYGSGWEDIAGVDSRRKGLAEEAIYMGRLLLRFMPDESEAQGLLALMLHCEARRNARRNEDGRYVPLSEQDSTLWSKTMIEEAETHLSKAAKAGNIGRFQLQAAIQSVHAQRAFTGRTEWKEIALLYEGLVRQVPTIGAFVGRAAAVAEAYGVDRGWMLLEAIPTEVIVSYQPYWALAAHLLTRMHRDEEARAAYSRAIGLCTDPALREFLEQQACQVSIEKKIK